MCAISHCIVYCIVLYCTVLLCTMNKQIIESNATDKALCSTGATGHCIVYCIVTYCYTVLCSAVQHGCLCSLYCVLYCTVLLYCTVQYCYELYSKGVTGHWTGLCTHTALVDIALCSTVRALQWSTAFICIYFIFQIHINWQGSVDWAAGRSTKVDRRLNRDIVKWYSGEPGPSDACLDKCAETPEYTCRTGPVKGGHW